MSLPENFKNLLELDGFVFFIEGKKGSGKTNFALLLMEICKAYRYREFFATNIKCQSYYVDQIINFPDLEAWLKTKHGKKAFILDESGKHVAKMSFMSTQNKSFMNMLQLIRHYDCGFIGIAPSVKRVDSGFLNTDILDAKVKKISLTACKVVDYYNSECYFLNDLPKTSISHSSKDFALFSMEKELDLNTLQDCCKAAYWYTKNGSYALTGNYFSPSKRAEQIKRLILQHIKHSSSPFSGLQRGLEEPLVESQEET
jgi:hypothetical protein